MITSLSTGTSGIKANMTALSVIGNNIANVNTVGFKSSRTIFSDVLSQSLTGGGSSQIGLGSQLSAVTPQFTQGAFETTGNGLDLALEGDGFFMVQDSAGANYYTRAGEFSMDKDNYIVNSDGYKLQGYGIDASGNILNTVGDIQISSAAIPANPTSSIDLIANLQSDAEITGFVFTTGSNDVIAANDGAAFIPSPSLTTDGGLTSGTAYTGDEVATAIKTALEARNNSADTYTVAYDSAAGKFTITNDAGNTNALNMLWSNAGTTAETLLGFAAADDNIAVAGNASSDNVAGAFDVNNASATSNYSTAITVYDSLGNSHLLNIYFRKSDIQATGNSWDWYAVVGSADSDSGSAEVQATGTIDFNTSGGILSQTPVTYWEDWTTSTIGTGFDFSGGATQGQVIGFDLGTGTDGVTQYGSDFAVYDQTQDGYESGSLQSLSIGDDGIINGLYTNGKTRNIGQIVVADFANAGGLVSKGQNLYAESADSGQPVVGAANASGRASVQSATLELSNVDLANEFIKMIAAQRGFQANSRVITTSDEILQELVNLKR